MVKLVHSFALMGVVLAASSPVWAQSDEQRANARALAAQGVQAFTEERWQDAVDLFERAESLVDAPTHLLFGARAHRKLHHYVKARELYLRISRQQLGPDSPRAFRNAQTSANQELSDVESHIGQLTVSIRGADPKTAKVTMDGTVVQNVLIGVSRPIDPGAHQVQAEAAGFDAQTKQVMVADGATASVVLELVPSAPASPVGAVPPAPSQLPGESAASPASSSSSQTTRTDEGAGAPSKGKRIGAYVAFGAGAVGIGLGAIFLSSSASKRSQADAAFKDCGGATGCTNANPESAHVASLDDSARSAQTLSIVGFAAGGLAVGAGALLFVLSGAHHGASSGLSIQPQLGLNSLGITGKFQ